MQETNSGGDKEIIVAKVLDGSTASGSDPIDEVSVAWRLLLFVI